MKHFNELNAVKEVNSKIVACIGDVYYGKTWQKHCQLNEHRASNDANYIVQSKFLAKLHTITAHYIRNQTIIVKGRSKFKPELNF
jgi:hypothetical protein